MVLLFFLYNANIVHNVLSFVKVNITLFSHDNISGNRGPWRYKCGSGFMNSFLRSIVQFFVNLHTWHQL